MHSLLLAAALTGHLGDFLGHDYIPDVGNAPTITSVQDGNANDPTTWDQNRVPQGTDTVKVIHRVVFDTPHTVTTLAVNGWTEHSAQLNVANLLVYSGGTTHLKPGCEIVIRDMPTGGQHDPKEWKTGVIVLGALTAEGTPKSHAIRAANNITAGTKLLTLESVPSNWSVGDRLLLPDTSQQIATRNGDDAGRLNEYVVVESINSNVITLKNPTLYNHKGIVSNPFNVSKYPHVCNDTRDIVIRSENPQGTRGHIAWHMNGYVDLSYVAVLDMGRTRNDELTDETIIAVDGSILYQAENPKARYPLHAHHSFGLAGGRTDSPYQSRLIGCVVDGTPSWAYVVHGSHYTLIDKCIAANCVGSGVMEEDGSEINNTYNDIVVVGCQGILKPLLKKVVTLPDGSILKIQTTGTNGSGVWLTRQASTATNCTSYACDGYAIYISGYGHGWESMEVALTRGSNTKTRVNNQSITKYGHKVENIEAVNCKGLMYYAWSQGPDQKFYDTVVLRDMYAWHCYGYRGIIRAYHDARLEIDGLWIINDPSVNANASRVDPLGMDCGTTYDLNHFKGRNINLSGLTFGVAPPTKSHRDFPNSTFEIQSGRFNCTHGIEFNNAAQNNLGPSIVTATFDKGEAPYQIWTWKSTEKTQSSLFSATPLRINGTDYYFDQQDPDYLVPAGTRPQRINGVDTDLSGLTNQQIFDTYGLILGGSFQESTSNPNPNPDPDPDPDPEPETEVRVMPIELNVELWQSFEAEASTLGITLPELLQNKLKGN